MNAKIALLLLSSLVLSCTVAYALWIKLRVIQLREDLYVLRARLFDVAVKYRSLNDPAYRKARQELNGIIRIAPELSVPSFAFLSAQPEPEDEPLRADVPEMERQIRKSKAEVVQRLSRFLWRETLSGLIIRGVFSDIPKAMQEFEAARVVENGVRSDVPRTIYVLNPRGRGRPVEPVCPT